jgi:regulator of protease activity HflC (stomatin/prohibitin superfamily)
MRTQEVKVGAIGGWLMACVLTVVLAGIVWLAVQQRIVPVLILSPIWVFVLAGFFTLQPNMGAVLVLFGDYKGTVTTSGWCWANPLLKKIKVSLRSRNLNGEKIKVNDKRGNPIEIALVVVWRVADTARAVFDVDDFTSFVKVQSEAALRHLASNYAYDTFESDDEQTLRGNMEEVSAALQKELQERVEKAGVEIEEARLSHLAYAPEIASAMLQRQQADAIVAARSRIVEGAIGMVEMALLRLEQGKAVDLDAERRAAMVSNLLVVLCGEHAATPVINTGTLYT